MQLFAFLVCFIFCLTLRLRPCDSQSHHEGNFVHVGNVSRCDLQCVVVGSNFGKDMKKLITEYRLITLDLKFEQRVDKKCLNQTNVYNVTKPADIWTWLADNRDNPQKGKYISRQPIGNDGSVAWFRKSFEGQIEVRVLCDLRITTLNNTDNTPAPLNDLIALVIMKDVANSSGVLSYTGTILCYKESAKNGSFVCLDVIKSNVPVTWSQRALGIIPIPIAFILLWYSPIILCLFSPTEVNAVDGSCMIVLSGTCPVSIRSRISNLLSSKNSTGWKMGITLFFLLIFIAAIPVLAYTAYYFILNLSPSSQIYSLKIDSISEFLQFIQFTQFIFEFLSFCVAVTLLFTLRNLLTFCCSKLSIEVGWCLTCELFRDDKTIPHQGFLEELKQHLRMQPSMIWTCYKYCLILLKKYFLKFECRCLCYLVFVLVSPITLIVLVALLVVFPLPMITVSIFYSCPLSSFNAMVLLLYRPDINENRKMRKCCTIFYSSIGSSLLFGIFVLSFGTDVFLISVLSVEVTRGLLMRLPDYLPVATLVVVVAFYCWSCYSSFTRKYYNLALKLYKHYTKNAEHKQATSLRDYEAPVIPKGLFEKACKDIMPLREDIGLLVVRLLSLLTFFFVVFLVIIGTPDASDQVKAAATFFTALVPKIIEMVLSKDPRMANLDDELLDKKVKYIVDEYSNLAENKNDIIIQNVMGESAENSV